MEEMEQWEGMEWWEEMERWRRWRAGGDGRDGAMGGDGEMEGDGEAGARVGCRGGPASACGRSTIRCGQKGRGLEDGCSSLLRLM